MTPSTANLKLQDAPHNIRQVEELKLGKIEEIALKIAYFDGKGVSRWDVVNNCELIENALREIGMYNQDTHDTLNCLRESARESN